VVVEHFEIRENGGEKRYDGSMLRHLRIAVTALSLTACLQLIALWVRSYGRREHIAVRASNTVALSAVSLQGQIIFVGDIQPVDRRPGLIAWTAETEQVTGWNLRWLGEPIERAKWGVGIQRLSLGIVGVSVQLPHWLLLLVLSTIAAAPWIHWSKRFSLRTLLIAMTLVAVVLGIVALLSQAGFLVRGAVG
jgi:hypothetical protein